MRKAVHNHHHHQYHHYWRSRRLAGQYSQGGAIARISEIRVGMTIVKESEWRSATQSQAIIKLNWVMTLFLASSWFSNDFFLCRAKQARCLRVLRRQWDDDIVAFVAVIVIIITITIIIITTTTVIIMSCDFFDWLQQQQKQQHKHYSNSIMFCCWSCYKPVLWKYDIF